MLYWDLSYAFERTSWRRPWEKIVGVVVERDAGDVAVSSFFFFFFL
jgi:hypothetical protein